MASSLPVKVRREIACIYTCTRWIHGHGHVYICVHVSLLVNWVYMYSSYINFHCCFLLGFVPGLLSHLVI